jgi:hypothetical protein
LNWQKNVVNEKFLSGIPFQVFLTVEGYGWIVIKDHAGQNKTPSRSGPGLL